MLRYLQLNLIVRFTPSNQQNVHKVMCMECCQNRTSNPPFPLSESKSFLMSSVLAGNLVLHKLHFGPTRLEFLPLLISIVVMYVMFHPSLSPSPVANIHCIGIYPTDNVHPFTLHTLQSKDPQSSRSAVFVFKIFYYVVRLSH